MKVIVPLAPGFEEIEAITIIDILRRAGIEVTTASTGDFSVTGSHNITVKADTELTSVNKSDFTGIVIPGGLPGSTNLRDDKRVIDLVRYFNSAGKTVAAICAAPIVLAKAGILTGKKACCYPGNEKDLTGADISMDGVVIDGNIITSRGLGFAIPFALKITEILRGEDTAQRISTGILFQG